MRGAGCRTQKSSKHLSIEVGELRWKLCGLTTYLMSGISAGRPVSRYSPAFFRIHREPFDVISNLYIKELSEDLMGMDR